MFPTDKNRYVSPVGRNGPCLDRIWSDSVGWWRSTNDIIVPIDNDRSRKSPDVYLIYVYSRNDHPCVQRLSDCNFWTKGNWKKRKTVPDSSNRDLHIYWMDWWDITYILRFSEIIMKFMCFCTGKYLIELLNTGITYWKSEKCFENVTLFLYNFHIIYFFNLFFDSWNILN